MPGGQAKALMRRAGVKPGMWDSIWREARESSKKDDLMLYRIAIVLLVLFAVAILWTKKLRVALSFVALIAVMAAIGFLAVVLLNLPSSPY
jgi:hypothetical protein